MKINLKMKLLSPLAHFGDERLGTMQTSRTMKFEYNGEFIDVPVFSGNAFRGELRRIAMRDYLEKIGIIEEGISAKLYYMLFTGGALTSGAKYVDIESKRYMRKMCPALSLLGTAIGDQIPEGKAKVGILKPVCKETAAFTGIESDKSFYDMLEEIFYTRRDDLKSKDVNITNNEKHENAIQMKYEMQCLSAGTELVGSITLENETNVEISCLVSVLEKFKLTPFIGGKSATGHGEVLMIYESNAEPNTYYQYLDARKDEMRLWLRETESKL
jgi:hypothetical protein